MDGISNIAGTRTASLRVGDKTYTLAPKVLAEYGERERYILSLCPSPFEALGKLPADFPADARARLERLALEAATKPQFIALDEDAAFDQSLHGIAWRLWRALRTNHPEIDGVQAALDLIEAAGQQRLAEIADKLDGAEEKDALKNSAGPALRKENRAEQPAATGATDASPGHSSTGTSLSDTAGHGTKSMT